MRYDYQQQQTQDQQQYLELANKPYSDIELAIIEHQKQYAKSIKTVFDKEE
jgi:hypothetical protein